MNYLIALIILLLLPSLVLTFIVSAIRPNWSRRRIALVSAVPVLLLALALSLWVFDAAASSSAIRCGVDACGMAMLAAYYLAGGSLAAFIIGWLISAFALVLVDRR